MKQFFSFLLAAAISSFALGQPVNDNCSGVIDLGVAPVCPVSGTFTNFNATASMVFSNPSANIPACFTGGVVSRDVWFSFSTPADGSANDITVIVTGVNGPNGSIVQPQVAVYRGECVLNGLQELSCATSPSGAKEVKIDLLGLTPGLQYFLRINDWSASATPNWGDFILCVKKYDPVFNMGSQPSTAACAGTLYDSGGPAGNYQNNQNLTFTICPQEVHQCILINVEQYNIEKDFDFINIFAGPNISSPRIAKLSGAGSFHQTQASSNCVTIQFTSDFSQVSEGFKLTWQCSADPCTVPPLSTCGNPTVIPSLPYSKEGLTTCFAGDEFTTSPCNNDGWLASEDYIFTYNSPGDECVAISITGSNNATGVAIYNACPDVATQCIKQAGGGASQSNPSINSAYLEQPGTYYIVVDNANSCTPFNISITPVECPIVFPSAAQCDNALSLNGCGDLPAFISVGPGQGDEDFIQAGVNIGCWGAFYPLNYTWFYFQARADGEFGFVMQSADPNEASDIDFQVWGPINSREEACGFARNNQPTRSSYAAGADPTGLANFHPITGVAILDTCETASGNDFLKPVQVQAGKYYFVLINDWGGQIVSGAVSVNFGNTTPGVLQSANMEDDFRVSSDTTLCPGDSVQLIASGGEIYEWFPATGLSCTKCPNPIATVTESTVYNVAINSICNADTLQVTVGLLDVDAGPDRTICLGEDLQINAGSELTGVTYAWTGPSGFLSCTDCPNPMFTAVSAGTHTFTLMATGPSCSFSDQVTMTVLPNPAPTYSVSDDLSICKGNTVAIGGQSTPGVNYNWSSNPPGFTSNQSNPNVAPSVTTTYYLQATNSSCPLPSLDSVKVIVSETPLLSVIPDTTICIGESVILGSTVVEAGVTYSWTPASGLDKPSSANPIATPGQPTTYVLTANRLGCQTQKTVNVNVTVLGVNINAPDTIGICPEVNVPLNASAFPANAIINWLPDNGTLNTLAGENVVASPLESTSYFAAISFNGCTKIDTVFIGVDSVPYNMEIMPADTQVCQGEIVYLISETYEPADFQQIEFFWSPSGGQLTPDSLYNMVVQANATTTYQRIAINGFCRDTNYATVNVIPVNSITVMPEQPIICQGDQVQLTATSPYNIDYEWEPAVGLSCANCPNPVASPPGTLSYQVKGEFEGCPVSGGVTVEVAQRPAVVFPNNVICPGTSLALNLGANANWDYVWTSSDNSLNSTHPNPTVSPTTNTTYYVTVSNGICAPVSDSVTIILVPTQTLRVSNDTIVCGTNPVRLTASTSGGIPGTFTWQPGNVTGPILQPVLQVGINTFMVTYRDAGGCQTLTDIVEVERVQGILITEITNSNSDTVYQGTTLTLGVETTVPPTKYQWSTGSASDTISVTPLLPPTISYSVTVTDEYGCTASLVKEITVLETKYDIPNVFTPNGDQLNQNFQVVIRGENIEVISIRVWNRWGQLVYQERNGNNGWDGNHKGSPAPSDVYIYQVQLSLPNGTVIDRKGDVTLLR